MKRAIIASAILVVVAFAWLVWPTPYSYYTLKLGPQEALVRVNRFTGSTSKLIANQGYWSDVKDSR